MSSQPTEAPEGSASVPQNAAAPPGEAQQPDPMLTTPTSPPPSICDLPAEIRVKIYKVLLTGGRSIRLTIDSSGNIKRFPTTPSAEIAGQVLRLCNQSYEDAEQLLYSLNEFWLNFEEIQLFDSFGAKTSEYLREINLASGSRSSGKCVEMIKALTSRVMCGLEGIDMVFNTTDDVNLLHAAVELSQAITPCAPMLDGPTLELHVLVEPKRHFFWPPWFTGENPMDSADRLWTRDMPLVNLIPRADPSRSRFLTKTHAPNLSSIRLLGTIQPELIEKIESHTCTLGDCRWKKVSSLTLPPDPDDPNIASDAELAADLAQSAPDMLPLPPLPPRREVVYRWVKSHRAVRQQTPDAPPILQLYQMPDKYKKALKEYSRERSKETGFKDCCTYRSASVAEGEGEGEEEGGRADGNGNDNGNDNGDGNGNANAIPAMIATIASVVAWFQGNVSQ